MYGSKTSHRGVQGSVLAEKLLQKRRISQLGIEEELVQLSRHPIEILCGGPPSIEKEAKGNEKTRHLTQLGTEEKSNMCNYQDCHLRFFLVSSFCCTVGPALST